MLRVHLCTPQLSEMHQSANHQDVRILYIYHINIHPLHNAHTRRTASPKDRSSSRSQSNVDTECQRCQRHEGPAPLTGEPLSSASSQIRLCQATALTDRSSRRRDLSAENTSDAR